MSVDQNHKRVGLLVPSSNTTIEVEFQRALPTEITVHVARLFLQRIEPKSISRLVEDLEREASYLATADVDVIVLGATAPSFLKGKGYDRELISRVEAATGKLATTTSTAMLRALSYLQIGRVALGTAFQPEVNDIAISFLQDNGVEVVASAGLGLLDNLEVGRLPASTAIEMARRIDRPDADAILLACTNWPSMTVIDALEKDLGKPVLSTTQVSLWDCLRLLGHDQPLSGWGQLLETYPAQNLTYA